MAQSKIEWTHYTCNFWYGCEKVSPACDHCYAETWGRRTGLMPVWNAPRRQASVAVRRAPFKWDRVARQDNLRRRVFTLSLGDFFDNRVDAPWRIDAWNTIRECSQLDWLILTKRPQNIRKMLPPDWHDGYPNVWLGCTVENMPEARRRLPVLLDIPAKVHWISAEPLFEQLQLQDYLAPIGTPGLHWVVCGGETGGNERVSDPDWFRDIRNQCADTGARFFMKQMTRKQAIPEDLLIREYPLATSPAMQVAST